MTSGQITASDIKNWNSLNDIAASFEKRGLKPHPEISEDGRLVLELADGEFIELVEASTGKSATDYKPESVTRHTNLVSTGDYETFTFVTRVRDWDDAHGRIKYQQFSFEKDQFRSDSGEKNTVLQKLNEIEYGKSAAVMDDLYDTRQIVKEFYEQFESLRTDLVQEVSGIPDDRGDAKGRYVQILLDRMIFLYFIQEKNLLDYDAEYLHSHHKRVVSEGADVYEDFFDPLFFDLLAEGKNDPDFGKLPYLNGGLFSKNPIEEEFENAKLGEDADKTNALFGRILDFLSDWNWNVDERLDIVDPKNLSPAVLGHIFEQTVNQKEMGAYYTPEEITGFMARRTIHPYLLDQLNEAEETNYESIDDVFALDATSTDGPESKVAADGGTLAHEVSPSAVNQDHVETLYFDVLKEARVLDPAVGSGAFLLAAEEVFIDIYLQCIEYFEAQESAEPWELSSRIKDELDEIRGTNGSETLYAKRTIILNNLYGVDIDDGAVEICKLRLWLSMVADIEDEPGEVDPLPNIDFNIRQGNSLVGYVDTLPSAQGKTTLGDWNVKEKFEEVIEAVRKHREATTSSEASNWRRIAEQRMEKYRNELNDSLADRMQKLGMNDIDADTLEEFDAFHWIVEYPKVIDDGGFDAVIGNPPWEVLSPNRDDFFTRYDERFRTYNADHKDEVQEELLKESSVETEWQRYRENIESRAKYFNKSPDYKLQSPKVNGRRVASENDLSALFLERTFNIMSDTGWNSLILPGFVFTGAIAKDLREHLLSKTTLETTVGFENKGIFEQIDSRYRFGILNYRNSGTTEHVRGLFAQTSTDILRTIDRDAAHISRRVLESYSPNARIFPSVTSQREADTLDTILSHPPLGESDGQPWWADILTKELHEPTDKGRLVESKSEGDYPVYDGANIYQHTHDSSIGIDIDDPRYWSLDTDDPDKSARARVRQKAANKGRLKKAIYTAFGGEKTNNSQTGFVDNLLEQERGNPLGESDILPDWTEYRIGFRDVARATDERTMIAAVLPKGVPCLHTLQTIRPFRVSVNADTDLSQRPLHNCYERVFSDAELFVAVSLLNSIAFDFLMRTKIDTHIVKYKLEESQMPRLSQGDDWFEYISSRGARLNCYGDGFDEMRQRLGGIDAATEEKERRRLRAEIDAAAFHAYGLDRPDTKFILDDFHRVQNPRLMTEEYFGLVLEKYDELAESGPHP